MICNKILSRFLNDIRGPLILNFFQVIPQRARKQPFLALSQEFELFQIKITLVFRWSKLISLFFIPKHKSLILSYEESLLFTEKRLKNYFEILLLFYEVHNIKFRFYSLNTSFLTIFRSPKKTSRSWRFVWLSIFQKL